MVRIGKLQIYHHIVFIQFFLDAFRALNLLNSNSKPTNQHLSTKHACRVEVSELEWAFRKTEKVGCFPFKREEKKEKRCDSLISVVDNHHHRHLFTITNVNKMWYGSDCVPNLLNLT